MIAVITLSAREGYGRRLVDGLTSTTRVRWASPLLLLALVTAPIDASGASWRRRLPKPVTGADYLDGGRSSPAKVELGRLLMFDKILSGNRNIACATCHHPLAWTGDGLSLSVGEGGRGLGVTRDLGSGADAVPERVPRNAPFVFNLGARDVVVLFHDGRVAVDPTQPSGFRTPAGDALPLGLENVLAAQAMFPVTSTTEMAGQPGENPIADVAAAGDLAGPSGVWAQLARRLQEVPEYVTRFGAAFADVRDAGDITFVHAANAIAAFEATAWRADDSPFDQYLRGRRAAMSARAKRGMKLFYGKARCAECHAGIFQTDQEFHAIAMPQIGPGKGHGPDGHDDYGREAVTGNAADRYRFRTPSLRQVVMTAPYGHDGAYATLEAIIRHHLDPASALERYDPSQARLPSRADLDAVDRIAHADAARRAALAAHNELEPRFLTKGEIAHLVDFLDALSDRRHLDLARDVPRAVPSGLPVFD
jgi:cytochrome c peroxidase